MGKKDAEKDSDLKAFGKVGFFQKKKAWKKSNFTLPLAVWTV
jgi:hypothetical protein